MTAAKRRARAPGRVRLKPSDSFDLIRLLAQTQSDPRKAICELVQNSLDARARHVDITWFREKGVQALSIVDDGEGVFPDLSREDALRRIATTIGHSHKRDLTPAQRRDLMLAGKYGIGLLGFWAIGRVMEIRSRVGGGEIWCLKLKEDSPIAEIVPVRRHRLCEPTTSTEITIRAVQAAASRQVRPGRLHAYLASELRGQLQGRQVDILIHDRVARGRAVKEFQVRAERFRGRLIGELKTLVVPGFDDASLELYMVLDDDQLGKVTLACGGTKVLDDMAEISAHDEAESPWGSGRFEGVIDFPALQVVPGTRRGFRETEASEAFLAALASVELSLLKLLEDERQRRREEKDRQLAQEVRRAFRQVARILPQYDLFDVRGPGKDPAHAASKGATMDEGERQDSPGQDDQTASEQTDITPDSSLFPPGPLAAVKISPARSRLPSGGIRLLRARALDADGRAAEGDVVFTWRLDGIGDLDAQGARASFSASDQPGTVKIHVAASQGNTEVHAQAEVSILDDLEAQYRAVGIPEPTPVHAPAEPWRSRIHDGGWEYNTGHQDYVAASSNESRRLRYLIHLFAKEVVLRNYGSPGAGELLERMVEILTYLGQREGGSKGSHHAEV